MQDPSNGWEAVAAEVIERRGLTLVAEHDDEGENHYYDTIRSPAPVAS